MSRRFGIINLYICSTLVTSFGSITAGDDFQGGEFNLGMRQLKQNDGPPNLEAKKTQQNNVSNIYIYVCIYLYIYKYISVIFNIINIRL